MRRICRDPTPSDTPSDSDTELVVPLADDSTEEDEEQEADCVFCTGRSSEDDNGEEWIRCARYFRWAQILCAGIEEKFHIEITNRFAALENLNVDEDVNRAWENIKENIKNLS
jgi:hypothetical protein